MNKPRCNYCNRIAKYVTAHSGTSVCDRDECKIAYCNDMFKPIIKD